MTMMLLLCRISSGWDSQDPGLPIMTIEHAKFTVQPAGPSMSYSISCLLSARSKTFFSFLSFFQGPSLS